MPHYELKWEMSDYYNLWQPWVKGYHGEYIVGFDNGPNFAQYLWLDQDLKEEMAGRK